MTASRSAITRVAAALAAAALAAGAAAQDFPSKPITMVVGFAPGGGTDTAARIIARKLAENIGQNVVVENKAGAGGNIAHQQVANAPADGHTILLGSVGPLAVAPYLMKDLPYDPQKDLAPLTMAVAFPNVLVVHAGVPAKTLPEFVALGKARPGEINYASSGMGSAAHMAGELFKQRAGIEMVHVPYKGGGPAMADLLGGRVTAYFATPTTSKPHIETGKLRALATTGLTRSVTMPDVPTVAELGFPAFEATNWYAFVAPGKTPPAILDRLNAELVKVLQDPGVKEQLLKHGLEPAPGSRADLANYIAAENATWSKVVKDAKLTAN